MSNQQKIPIDLPKEDPKKPDPTFADKDLKRDVDQQKFAEKGPDDAPEEPELSPEDKKLKENLGTYVQAIMKESGVLQATAIESLRSEIRSSTSSMTSVPKPLKFMRPHYPKLVEFYQKLPASDNKRALADVLSVLSMTMAKEDSGDTLRYVLEGTGKRFEEFGHSYISHLAGEVGVEYQKRSEAKTPVNDLMALVERIVTHNIKHNAEVEASDLLIEVEQLKMLEPHISKDNAERLGKYLCSCAVLTPDPDEHAAMLAVAFNGFLKAEDAASALRVALRLGDQGKVAEALAATQDPAVLRQMSYQLGSVKMKLESKVIDQYPDHKDIMGNCHMTSMYGYLAKELGVADPKTPEDIYKTHLTEGHGGIAKHARPQAQQGATVDSAKQNLASTFVNAFVNCGFGRDMLMTPEGSDWLFKNKQHGMTSAAASLGMILLWDVESFSATDKYSASNQAFVKAGSLLASGILPTGVTSEFDAAHALLADHVNDEDLNMRTSAIIGLGIAYAGQERADVLESLVPLIVDSKQPVEVVALACLSIGMVYVGSANSEVTGSIIEAFLDRSDTDLKDSSARLMCLGLALCYLGTGEAAEGALRATNVLEKQIKKFLQLAIDTCAYVGTGNVMQIQKLMSVCADHLEEDEKEPMKNIHQEVAVLGIAMIAMGENLASQMALRCLDHILQYGEVNIRRAIPIALGLLSISNPQLTVMDTLSKLSHDQDQVVSQNACFALGLLGAGTNNSRIANMLRQLAAYYEKEPNHLFIIRIAQGLLHIGKGLLTLNPFQSESFLLNKVAMAGLLTVLHCALDLKNSFLGKRHYLLYTLACTVRPRCLITVDETGKPVPVTVRVGQAVDTVGQAGKPRTITGFQTHKTPVLLAAGERVEMGTDKYIPLSSVLEGFVVVKKNPNARDRDDAVDSKDKDVTMKDSKDEKDSKRGGLSL